MVRWLAETFRSAKRAKLAALQSYGA